jgi:hypothetical protein
MMFRLPVQGWLACLALIVASAARAAAQSNAGQARLAILTADPAVRAAGGILTAAFSKSDRVTLLERTEIEKSSGNRNNHG